MSKKFGNSKKANKLLTISNTADLLSLEHDLTTRSKVNFSYLDTSQIPGYSFNDLTPDNLIDLLEKIKEHGKHSLLKLQRMPIGGGSTRSKRGNILKFYDSFPPKHKTRYKEPLHTPEQVRWGCIRLSGAARLVGFIVSPELHDQKHQTTNERFDKNTFYVVFLDMDHQFWLYEK